LNSGNDAERVLQSQIKEHIHAFAIDLADLFAVACRDGSMSVDEAITLLNKLWPEQPDIIRADVRLELTAISQIHDQLPDDESPEDDKPPGNFGDMFKETTGDGPPSA